MLYQFDAEGAGTVIAEDKLGSLTYVELLPASDIPKQAKGTVYLNLLRLIPDVNYQPIELISVNDPVSISHLIWV